MHLGICRLCIASWCSNIVCKLGLTLEIVLLIIPEGLQQHLICININIHKTPMHTHTYTLTHILPTTLSGTSQTKSACKKMAQDTCSCSHDCPDTWLQEMQRTWWRRQRFPPSSLCWASGSPGQKAPIHVLATTLTWRLHISLHKLPATCKTLA